MTTFDAGTVGSGAGTPVIFKETVHGPVLGYATVDGERVALSSARSTRGREVVSAFGFADLNANVPTDAESFFDVVSQIEFTFNWFYADEDDIAMFSSGRMPVRHPHVDLGLPDEGHRQVRVARLPERRTSTRTARRRADGTIVNWNNKPAAGLAGGGRHVVLRLGAPQRPAGGTRSNASATHTLASTVAAMNKRRHAGPAVAKAFRGDKCVLEDGPRAERRAPADVELLQRLARAGIEPARPRPQRQDRPPGGGDHGQGMAEDRGRGDGPGARARSSTTSRR